MGCFVLQRYLNLRKNLHSEMEKVVLMDTLPESWTYPLMQPKLIEKYWEKKTSIGIA